MAGMHLLDEHAQDRAGLGEQWRPYHYEVLNEPGQPRLVKLIGAIAPPFVRGPRKGTPNWRQMDRATMRTIYITGAENDEWCRAWQERTGKCIECQGNGEVLQSWSSAHGTTMKACSTCGGTGKVENVSSGNLRAPDDDGLVDAAAEFERNDSKDEAKKYVMGYGKK